MIWYSVKSAFKRVAGKKKKERRKMLFWIISIDYEFSVGVSSKNNNSEYTNSELLFLILILGM